MKLNTIMKNAGVIFKKTKFKLTKNSPEIAVAAGIIGVVASAVLACRATTKISEIAEDTNAQLAQVNEYSEKGLENYTPEDAKKDTIIIYSKTALKFVKLYAPSVLLGALSIASIIYSHNVLKKRNMALMTACTGLQQTLNQYRKRVSDAIGEEKERDIFYGTKLEKIEETVTDENGKQKKVKKTHKVFDPTTLGMFAAVFGPENKLYQEDESYNIAFLHSVEDQMTNRLRSYGHLFLNEVYDVLGIDRAEIGQYAGWVYDPTSDISDNYVDFGLYDGWRSTEVGLEKAIIINPNCDGCIMSKVFKKG